MSLITTVQIGNCTLKNIIQGAVYKDTHDSNLSSVIIKYHSNTKPSYKLYDVGVIGIGESYKKYMLCSISPTNVNGFYETILIFAELTKYLERTIIDGCSFTNLEDTLFQQIQKLIYKTEIILDGETPRFNIDNLYELTKDVPGENFFFEGRMTLREILDSMLAAIGVRSTVEDMVGNTVIIGYYDLKRVSTDVKAVKGDLVGETETESLEYLANEYKTSITNASSRERRAITDEWTTVKPTSLGIADTNGVKLSTNALIDEIKTLKCRTLPISITYIKTINGISNEYEVSDIYVDIDITNYIVESSLYNSMSQVDQEKHIPYQRGTNNIGVLETYKVLFFTYNKLIDALNTSLVSSAYNALLREGIATEDENVVVTIVYLPNSGSTFENYLFQTSYVPYLDINVLMKKDHYESDIKSEMIFNQTEQTVDINRFAEYNRSMINVLGNKSMEKSAQITSIDKLLALGDKIENDYVLISREYSVFDRYIKVHYIFVQGFEAALTARLDRAKEMYKIPLASEFDENINLKDYLVLSATKNKIDNGYMKDDYLLPYLLKTFNNAGDDNKPIDKVLIETEDSNGTEYGVFSLGLLPISVGKSATLSFRFYDNYSVGLSTGSRVLGGKTVYSNPYVDGNGEYKKLKLQFIKSNLDSASFENQLILGQAMPVVPQPMINLYKQAIYSNQISILRFKDRYNGNQITYQQEAITYDENIIIGNSSYKYANFLFGTNQTKLYFWYSASETYDKRDVKKCKGIKDEDRIVLIDDVNHRLYVDSLPNGTKSWSIGDEHGNLIYGMNTESLKSIYFTIKRY